MPDIENTRAAADCIFHRTSVRKWQDRPVEQDKLERILRAGMQAPSAGNQQPWEFWVVDDTGAKEALSQASEYAGCAAHAPVLVVPAYRTEGLRFPEYAQIDLAIATENMWLEADGLGLGGVWLGIAPLADRMDKVAAVLGMPEGLKAFAILCLGYPEVQQRPQQDRFDAARIHRA